MLTSNPSHVMKTYNNLPIFLSHGQGVWVWDEAGRKYLDGLAGIAVNTLGHNHARLVAAITAQAQTLIHSSNLYKVRNQETLADRLTAIARMDNVFFCNSGLEANEAALKIARKYGHDRGIDRPEIIVYEDAFHGRSIATLSATGNEKVQKGFEPLVEGFVRVPLNDLQAIESAARAHRNIVAVFVEAIQGEGGINLARIDYLQGLRRVCDERGWLLMIDEVQCGMARTGRWFAHQWADIVPDVMPLAKGLASAEVFGPGNHGTTFGGNPLATRAALETLATIEADGLMHNAQAMGERIRGGLLAALGGLPGFVEIRGRGLMLGLELDRPCGELVQSALDLPGEHGLLINVTHDRVVRLLPPLILNAIEADLLVAGLVRIISEFLQQTHPELH
jgi:acetylornithine aminotransferase